MKTIILADNQDITKLGWKFLFNQNELSVQLIEVENKRQLIDSLVLYPDSLVILDFSLFDFNSIDELYVLENRFTEAFWLLFSEELSESFLQSLFHNTQLLSVIMKSNSIDEIRLGLNESLKSRRYICSYVSNILLDKSKKPESKTKAVLTATELEILKEMSFGKTTKEIALHRNVSVHTIITHRKNIFRKLEVNTMYEATRYAMRAGIVDLSEYYI